MSEYKGPFIRQTSEQRWRDREIAERRKARLWNRLTIGLLLFIGYMLAYYYT
jgi:hypothetical protein